MIIKWIYIIACYKICHWDISIGNILETSLGIKTQKIFAYEHHMNIFIHENILNIFRLINIWFFLNNKLYSQWSYDSELRDNILYQMHFPKYNFHFIVEANWKEKQKCILSVLVFFRDLKSESRSLLLLFMTSLEGHLHSWPSVTLRFWWNWWSCVQFRNL